MRIQLTSFLVLLILVLTACAPSQIKAIESPRTPLSAPTKQPLYTLMPFQPTQGVSTEMNPFSQTPPVPGLEGLIEQAQADLAQRLSVSVTQINVVEARGVVWPDSSLGCPRAGMAYTQVLTSGFLILLETGGKEYEYHANSSSYVFPCDNPAPPVPGMPGDT